MHEIYCAINDHKFIVHAHTDLGADERYIFVCLIRRRHCKTLSILVRIQEIPTTTVSIPGDRFCFSYPTMLVSCLETVKHGLKSKRYFQRLWTSQNLVSQRMHGQDLLVGNASHFKLDEVAHRGCTIVTIDIACCRQNIAFGLEDMDYCNAK
uniref:Uncharacterized protein n=1 Tax=Hyaloperonospora arabidopsidis (strain Emoy2) TaxID=559515 RepID=M4BSL9_HYAAE